MWRAPQNLTGKARSAHQVGVLVRHCSKPAASQAKTSSGEKDAAKTTPTPPPPPPQSSGGGGGIFLKLMGLTLVGAGGAVGYAWYDQEFRKTIESNVPYSKEMFDTLFQLAKQEKSSIPPASPAGDVQPALARPITVPEPISAPKKAEPAVEVKKAEPVKPVDTKKVDAEEKKRLEKERVAKRLQEKEMEEAAENAALEEIVGSITGSAVESVRLAIDAQIAAAKAARAHSLQLKTAMENDEKGDKNVQWESVSGAHEAKLEAVAAAESAQKEADEALEKLKHAIQDGKDSVITKKNKALVGAQETLNQMSYDLKSAMAEQSKALSESKVMQDYRDLVKKGKVQFKKELEAIMPDVKLGNRFGGRMTEEELNSLIAHAHRRIEQLQKQLAEQQALEELRTGEALDIQRKEDEKLAEEMIQLEQERLKALFALERQKIETEADVQFEQDLRQQLARQAAAHSDHLKDVLKVQESELHKKYQLLFSEKLVDESNKIRSEVSDSISRLRGIEKAIDGRAEMEKQGRKAQELWLACQTLYNIVLHGAQKPDAETLEDNQQPLAGEVAAIKEAGNDHPFVNTVINSMPEEALTRGVYTEEAMSERFQTVRRVCRRVSMIDETGGTLFRYFLSYIQSFVVFSKSRALTPEDEVVPGELDTFMILDNAAYCLEKGDHVQALRYMNQLRGEPRRVAADWIADMRCLLETKQAADALLAHASAAGLGALF